MTAIAEKTDGLTQMRALAASRGGSGMGALMAMDGGEAGEGTMIMHAIPGSSTAIPSASSTAALRPPCSTAQ